MLILDNIFFAYADEPVLADISLRIPRGNHLAVIGESGCGKSTLLKLIYGIYDADEGQIIFNSEVIRGPKFNLLPGKDNIKYLAQDFGLMPYITVAENIGRYLSNVDKATKKTRIDDLLTLVGLSEFSSINAQFLSGGQQQRTALAMALASEPELLLLDEPFSQIDRFQTKKLQRAIYDYCKRKQITVIVASHDSDDFLPFSDEIAVLRKGKLVQFGTPIEIYNQPNSHYTASLFGEVNYLPATLLGVSTSTDSLLVYPHQLHLAPIGIECIVIRSRFYGSYYMIQCKHIGSDVFFNHSEDLPSGKRIYLSYTK